VSTKDVINGNPFGPQTFTESLSAS